MRLELHYAEYVNPETRRIEDKGIFFSVDEFVPYRLRGWSGLPDFDAAADAKIEKRRNQHE